MFSKKNTYRLPFEVVDYIILFADDSKKIHNSKLSEVCNDIIRMSEIMECERYHLNPRIAKMCWGSQSHLLPNWEEIEDIGFFELGDEQLDII